MRKFLFPASLILVILLSLFIWLKFPGTFKWVDSNLMTADPDTLSSGVLHIVTFKYKENKSADPWDRIACWQDGIYAHAISVTPTEARVETRASPMLKGTFKFEITGTSLYGYVTFDKVTVEE
jgi:hypothetical protein